MKHPGPLLLDETEIFLDTSQDTPESETHKSAADLLLREGRYAEALNEYQVALTHLGPQSPTKANVLSNMAAALLRLGRDLEAEQAARDALDINSRHRNARLRLARSLMRQEEYLTAAGEWAIISQLGPLTDAEAKEKDECEQRGTKAGLEKLKGWGNQILGKFGLSLDNFRVQKNPDGSMNISVATE
ncbi:Tetratricopeptide repeat protein [Giardia muris]|uniref:Tetratricopeptide repeat protein n=1 Tax=Giardia muris TaxID=5742 RepID=A0A4Z1SL75_GIAMU|nr:Tetratricopeptide repeat protein [Giardia muris]|eukprot:TNJ26382.1 Tetratricopeptide repeat protein [Giardia muris]